MAGLVSVAVVSWNGRSYLEECLASLLAQSYPEVEIILVDNASSDGTVDWVREHFPQVQLILNPVNRGFAAANNQAIRRARGEYIATLNNDAWVEANWLAELVRRLEQDPRVGMAASHMVFAGRPEVINSTGICVDRCGISWDRNSGEIAHPADREETEVFGACAGAALYRRALFDEVGLFDEDFFLYLEDVDLAWRARWYGWRAVYVPSARVQHVHSGTAREGSPWKTYWLARNKILLIAGNYPLPYLIFYLPLILFYELLSLAFSVLSRTGLSALRGRFAGLLLVGRAVSKRRARRSGSRVSGREIFHLLEPVAGPWQVYRRYRHLARSAGSSPSRWRSADFRG